MLEEAKFEVLRVVDMFEKLGATNDTEYTRELLRWIHARRNGRSGYPSESGDDGELLETVPLVAFINFTRSDRVTESE